MQPDHSHFWLWCIVLSVPGAAFAGFACLSNPCVHGVCIDDLNTTYACFCMDGFTGVQCQTNWNECWSNPCRNGGLCIDGIAAFNCTCPPGFVGDLCEEDYNECDSNPCQNNGTCVDITNGYSCNCASGYSGDYCEVDIAVCNINNETRCSNGGICVEGLGLSFSCRCPPGWGGFLCDSEIDECMSAPCQNGAVCIDLLADYNCACLFGFAGKSCEEEILQCEDNVCRNNALCLMEDDRSVCYCVPDFHGDKCQYQYDECQLGPRCLNGGSCIDGIDSFTCSCPPNLTGVLCECLLVGDNKLDCSYISGTSATTIGTTSTSTNPIISTTIKLSTSEFYLGTATTLVPNLTTFSITSTQQTTLTDLEEETTLSTSTESTTVSNEPVTETTTETFTTFPTFKTSTTVSSTSTIVTSPTSTIFTTETTLPIETTQFFTDLPTSTETTTIFQNPDCSKSDSKCQNGGTCIYTSDGYKCLCPYDTEGFFCESSLGFENAAFGGDSFLTHRVFNVSKIRVEFTVRTLSSNGLIFHANYDVAFMTLYVEGGYLKFLFSCGCQTMLLSELKNPINNGFPMKVNAYLDFASNYSRCNASVTINSTSTMSGDQLAHIAKFGKKNSTIHLGGLPQISPKDTFPSIKGFIGCINNLKISGRNVSIFKDAENGFKVTECVSLACLSNPCLNEGNCIPDGEKWECQCKNGYQGSVCENSVCDNNPCLFGATCLPFSGSGYICLCPFGKHGHFCENDFEITRTHFSLSIRGYSSFAAYPIPPGGVSDNMELSFKFSPSTIDQISILLFVGQEGVHDFLSDHLAVSFVKGYVMLTWNLGSGPRRIFTSRPIVEDRNEHVLRLGRNGRRAWLLVDDLGNVTGRAPGKLTNLDVEPTLFLGGHSSVNFANLPHDLPLHTGFLGCIHDVQLKSGTLSVPLQRSSLTIGRALGQCGTTECHENLCQNSGACLHHGGTFTCLCQDGWFGPLCSSKFNPCDHNRQECRSGSTCVPLLDGYECDCPLGHTGKHCQKGENLSDVSLSGIRSYISVPVGNNLDSGKFTISLQIRPLNHRGLVLYMAQEQNGFVSLSLQSNLLELRVVSAKVKFRRNQIVAVRSTNLLALGNWYKIRLGKFGNKVYITVDNVTDTGVIHDGEFSYVSSEPLYLGGLPDMSLLPSIATPILPIPFKGCIRHLSINSIHIPLTIVNITKARNVADCDGTPCGGDSCENAGSCWLDSSLNPHCSCIEPFKGDRCEELTSCHERPCSNKGVCVKSKCYCPVGFMGPYCETPVNVQVPEFTGSSYLIVDKSNRKRNILGHSFSMNFTTANKNGLILWINEDQEKRFFGLGVENCKLKLVYSSQPNKTNIEMPSSTSVCDGFWHGINITLSTSKIDVTIDGEKSTKKIDPEETIPIEGLFYLGGFPREIHLSEKTHGLFTKSFSGCITSFSIGELDVVKNISSYDGENIGICSSNQIFL